MKSLILLLVLAFSSLSFAIEFVTMQPGTVSQVSSVRNSATWSNINNVLGTADTRYASASVANNGYSQTILVTNFQFNIPTDAVIEGIQVVWSKGSQATGFNDSDISLVVAGSVVNTTNKCAVAGSNVCKSWLANGTATFRDDSYGAQNDLWGLSLTPADVNAVGFGASLQVKRVVSSVRAAYVESVKMSVFYSVPIVPPTVAPTVAPTQAPTQQPTQDATHQQQTQQPTQQPTQATQQPTQQATQQDPSVAPSAFTQSATEVTPNPTLDPTVNAARANGANAWLLYAMMLMSCVLALL